MSDPLRDPSPIERARALFARPLESRRAIAIAAIVIAAALALHASSIDAGFYNDDYFHIAALEGRVEGLAPYRLYEFTAARPHDPAQGHLWPWWSSPTLELRFMRPLASLSIALDHALFGHWARGYHLGNLALFLLTAIAIAVAFARLTRRSGRGIATYALAIACALGNESFALPVAWVSDRHALIALGFSLCALVAWDAHRSEGGRRSLVVALGCAIAALASGEVGFALFAWAIAYELTVPDAPLRRRLAPVFAIAVAAMLYVVVHRGLGYGVAGLAYYRDPFADPLGFASEAIRARLPFDAIGTLTPIPADLGDRSTPSVGIALSLLGWGLVLAIGAWVVRRRERALSFVALGALFSLVLACTSRASDRGLALPVLAAAWMAGAMAHDAVQSAGPRSSRVARFVAPLLLAGFALGPVQVVRWQSRFGADNEARRAVVESATWPSEGAARVLVLRAPPDTAAGLVLTEGILDVPEHAATWIASLSPGRHRIVRLDAQTLRLEVSGPGLFTTDRERTWLPLAEPAEGDVRRVGGLEVRVLERRAGRDAIALGLGEDLDDGRVVLLAWDGTRLARIEAPPVGQARGL